jgi:hypothetical protein
LLGFNDDDDDDDDDDDQGCQLLGCMPIFLFAWRMLDRDDRGGKISETWHHIQANSTPQNHSRKIGKAEMILFCS